MSCTFAQLGRAHLCCCLPRALIQKVWLLCFFVFFAKLFLCDGAELRRNAGAFVSFLGFNTRRLMHCALFAVFESIKVHKITHLCIATHGYERVDWC